MIPCVVILRAHLRNFMSIASLSSGTAGPAHPKGYRRLA